MLKLLRQKIIRSLWEKHCHQSSQIQKIKASLQQKNIAQLPLDHFAIIDLPGPHTGIPILSEIFSMLGFIQRGQDYLPDKQNDFIWMAEHDSDSKKVHDVLPQVVLADFRLDELPTDIRKIILKYTQQSQPPLLSQLKQLAEKTENGDHDAANQLHDILIHYFSGRDWPLPTQKEFYAVQEFNKLIAWVFILGRAPNHFTLSVHLLDYFRNMNEFNFFIENEVNLTLNQEGGVIKGGEKVGIAQSATIDSLEKIKLADGEIELPLGFVEFVFRYPLPAIHQPILWRDYFTDFIANHANRVIESLYVKAS